MSLNLPGASNPVQPFRFWCQTVLPMVYDDSLSYYELLCKVVAKLNEAISSQNDLAEAVQNEVNEFEESITEKFNTLKGFVDDYFTNLNVQQEINKKLDAMATDGSLSAIILPLVKTEVDSWLSSNIGDTNPPLDSTLTLENAAARSLTTGYLTIPNRMAMSGGFSHLSFEQGSISFNSNGYATYSNSSLRCRSLQIAPVIMPAGSVITAAEGFDVSVTLVSVDSTGFKRVNTSFPYTQSITIPTTGLYVVAAQKTGHTVSITPDEAYNAITVEYSGLLDDFNTFIASLKTALYPDLRLYYNPIYAQFGGYNTIELEIGSVSISNGYFTPSSRATRTRTPITRPLALKKGDIINFTSGWMLSGTQAQITANGVAPVGTATASTNGVWSCPSTGLWQFVYYPGNDSTTLVLEDVLSTISVTHIVPDASNEEFIALLKTQLYPDLRLYKNPIYAVFGGTNKMELELGSISQSGGYFVGSNRVTRCRTPLTRPLALKKGDTISFTPGWTFSATRCFIDSAGSKPAGSGIVTNTGTWYCPQTGLYVAVYWPGNDSTALDLNAAIDSVTINHTLVNDEDTENELLPKNPYKNVIWDSFKEVISTTHAHATTQDQFETLAGFYEHIALANYYPAMPYWPLDQKFENVPATLLASPNAEHSRFTGLQGGVHANSLGSFISSMNAETIWTLKEMCEGTERMLQYVNGGGVTLNHPAYSKYTQEQALEFANYPGVIALEVYNAGGKTYDPDVSNSEQVWDWILASGKQIFGVAVPDHEIQYHSTVTSYGFGYNHVLVPTKTAQEVMLAYRNGQFYCSEYNDDLKVVSVSYSNTQAEITVSKPSTITCITATGNTVSDTEVTTLTVPLTAANVYARFKVTSGNNTLYTNAFIL